MFGIANCRSDIGAKLMLIFELAIGINKLSIIYDMKIREKLFDEQSCTIIRTVGRKKMNTFDIMGVFEQLQPDSERLIGGATFDEDFDRVHQYS
jgi:hypothetical protein